MTARVFDRACDLIAWLLVTPLFYVCRLGDTTACNWANTTAGDES